MIKEADLDGDGKLNYDGKIIWHKTKMFCNAGDGIAPPQLNIVWCFYVKIKNACSIAPGYKHSHNFFTGVRTTGINSVFVLRTPKNAPN